MPEKVKLGFIGCGFMGQCVHLPSFKRAENVEIVAISDLRIKLAKAVAERWTIRKVYSFHLEMMQDEEIDAIVEITNKSVHAPIALDALKAGKHVFTEKPIATNTKDAEEMVKAAEKNDLKLMVDYMKRYDTGVLKAKEVFEDFVKSDKVTYVRFHLFGGDWLCGSTAEQMIKTEETYPEIKPRFPDFVPKEFVKATNNLLEQIHVYRAGKIQRDESPHGTWSWSFERQAQHFIDCIVEDKEPISSGFDSFKDIVIIESMLKAAIEGKRIEIKS